jgi:hypothetical protein
MSSQFNKFLAAAHRDDLRRAAERSRAAERRPAEPDQADKRSSSWSTSISSAWRGRFRSLRKVWGGS